MTNRILFLGYQSSGSLKKVIALVLLLTLATGFSPTDCFTEESQSGSIVMDIPGLPIVVDLDIGESIKVTRTTSEGNIERELKLVSLQHYWQPDLYIEQNPDQRTLSKAEVVVEVSGEKVTLLHRPYQLPLSCNGLRLYVETTKTWATQAQLADMEMQKDVRLSICAEGESWSPKGMSFPIQDFRWRSSTYNNTWGALVPYNLLYYHRGEDFGAIPDRLDVVAGLDGTVISSPLPNGDGKSNGLIIKTNVGFEVRYAHMNTESMAQDLVAGSGVNARQKLGKTGATWMGAPRQHNDPHLHFAFHYEDTYISPFPAIIDAYFNTFPDEVLACAGGYYFTLPGQPVELDATRSVARSGKRIHSYQWKLHDHRIVHQTQVTVQYDQPGLYSEELIVKTDEGTEDRDFAQVRVFDPQRERNITAGWCHYTPVRGIKPDTPILFWNRLWNTTTPVMVDFGDGSQKQQIKDELMHSYNDSGIYTVLVTSTGPEQEPVTVKMKVVVEESI